MEKETVYIDSLLDFARNEDWDSFDQHVQNVSEYDDNTIGSLILPFLTNNNPYVRDGAVSLLSHVHISDEALRTTLFDEVEQLVKEDHWVYAAGRAMVTLLTYEEYPNFTHRVHDAKKVFFKRVKDHEWTTDLRENIPELEPYLT